MPIFGNNTGKVGASVNNAIRDPFQGHDCTLWMLDAQGNQVNRGAFTSVQLTFRNATEPYMELNQRVPRYLDGDFQIGWVAQKGMVDMLALSETFGFDNVTREARVSRSPRFNLVWYVAAEELELAEAAYGTASRTNKFSLDSRYGEVNGRNKANVEIGRKAKGKIVLLNCKIDTFAIGVTSGQKVVANQWEGLAEGYATYLEEPGLSRGTGNVINTFSGAPINTPSLSNATTLPF